MTAAGSIAPARKVRADESDFLELSRQIRQAGLFARTPVRSAVRAATTTALFAAGWVAFFAVGDSWWQLLVAPYMAIMFVQLGFLGHDIGHRQVFRSRRLNRAGGLACANLGIGFSYGYWVDKHDRHHGRPNEVGADPDVGEGVIAWTADQARSKRRLGRLIARHQALLFFPMLCLEGASLHVASFRALSKPAVKRPVVEGVLLCLHLAAYTAAVVAVLSPLRALVFVVVQQGLFGLYLGCSFAPNHKGMTMPEPGEAMDFLRRQVTTSRNVAGGRLLAVAMGGLNYQIEHHLFPSMPMANLRRCRTMVRAHCAKHRIVYTEVGVARSYVMSLRYLRTVGRSLDVATTAA